MVHNATAVTTIRHRRQPVSVSMNLNNVENYVQQKNFMYQLQLMNNDCDV